MKNYIEYWMNLFNVGITPRRRGVATLRGSLSVGPSGLATHTLRHPLHIADADPYVHKKRNWIVSSSILLLTFLCLSSPDSLKAQVDAPILSCIKNDTLVWSVPSASCGPFLGLDIFFATERNGPYNLIQTITDPVADFYIHDDISPLRYYYLVARFDCADGISPPSDTLDNLPPTTVRVDFVTVENSGVRIQWQQSASPQTVGYIIYRSTNQGTIPIDTVFGVLSYLDLTARPDLNAEFYYVIAMDACGTRGGFDIPHNTILSASSFNECTREATLQWTDYSFWEDGVVAWEILMSINGGPENIIGTAPGDARSFVYPDLTDATDYCFTIVAREGPNSFRSASNSTCFRSQIINPVGFLCIDQATVTGQGQVSLQYAFSDQANLEWVRVLRGNSPATVTELLGQFNTPTNLNSPYGFIDQTADTGNQPYFYQIITRDLCGVEEMSPVIGTVYLQGTLLPGRQNALRWNPMTIDPGATLRYDVFRVNGNQRQLLATLSSDNEDFVDQISGPSAGSTRFCYQIVSSIETNCDGSLIETLQQSNVACIDQNSSILVPNALVIGGQNNLFKPVILYPESIEAYAIFIYDRFGSKVFESTDPNQGWDGTKGGRGLPLGVYHFYIRATQTNGRVIEEAGPITLVR
jgi:gliding motility-associated-like protein